MKQVKFTAIVMALLLSVSSVASAFAEETLPVAEVITQQAEAAVLAPAVENVEPVVVVETAAPVSTEVATVPEVSDTPTATETPNVTGTPEATQTPADTATPEATQTPDSTTQEPAQTAQPIARSVEISMDIPNNLQLGDTVTLTATLIGYDDVNVALQWQYTKNGEDWFDAQGDGSTTLTYAFTVSDENAGTGWRLGVTIL